MICLPKIQLLRKLVVPYTIGMDISNKILEGLMIVPNHHKGQRYIFIFKGGIETAKLFGPESFPHPIPPPMTYCPHFIKKSLRYIDFT